LPPSSIAVLESSSVTQLAGPINLGSGSTLIVNSPLEITPGGGLSFTRHDVPGSTPTSARILTGDIDDDGDLDIVESGRLWLNTNDLSQFKLSASPLPSISRVADMNSDGIVDLLSSDGWYTNQPDQPDPFTAFQEWPEKENFFGLSDAVDFNNDGHTDVLMLGFTETADYETEFVLLNNGEEAPTFTPYITGEGAHNNLVSNSVSSAIGDFSGDGYQDYMVAYSGNDAFFGYTVYLRTNRSLPTPSFSGSVLINDINEERSGLTTAADIDGDGADEPVFVSNGVLFIFGTQSQINWPISGSPKTVLSADLNNDSAEEILILNTDGNLTAYRSLGQGIALLDKIDLYQNVNQVAIADIDSDGDQDLLLNDDTGLAIIENTSSLSKALTQPGSSILTFGPATVQGVEFNLGPDTSLESDTLVQIDQGSIITGSGRLTAPSVHSSGVLRPDHGETLLINGDYQQTIQDGTAVQAGQMQIHLGNGTSPHSAVSISGEAVLAGSLIVTADPGFDPDVGTEYVILTAGSPIGANRFNVALLPGLGNGKFLRTVYDQAPVAPTYDQSSVPEGSGSVTLVVDSLDGNEFGDPTGFLIPGVATGAVLGDLNDDGFDDLAVVIPDDTDPQNSPGTLALLINAQTDEPPNLWPGFSSQTILLQTGPAPTAVTIGDIDQLFGNDIAVAIQSSGNAEIFISNGNPDLANRFIPITPIQFNERPEAIALSDVDNDTFLDVLLAGHPIGGLPSGPGEVTVRLNQGTSGLVWNGLEHEARGFIVGSRPRDIVLSDLDEEKDLDLISANWGQGTLTILENLGNSGKAWIGFNTGFDLSVGSGPIRVFAIDLDEEKDLDLISFNTQDGSMSIILADNPNATSLAEIFGPAVSVPVGLMPISATMWDPDLDGDPDPAVVVTNSEGDRVVRLLLNLAVENSSEGTTNLSFVVDRDIETESNPYSVLSGRLNNNEGDDLAVLTETTSGIPLTGKSDLGSVYFDQSSSCRADVNGDGQLNFLDISQFLQGYGAQSQSSDWNADGLFNFLDISGFLNSYSIGCP
jgi:hypothetical protein